MLRGKSVWRCAVAIALVSLIFPGCDNNRQEIACWEAEREKNELAQRLELMKYRYELSEPGAFSELARLENTMQELDRRTGILLRNLSDLGVEIAALERQNEDFERLAIQNQRMNALGRKFGSFALKDGRTFRNVSITGVDDGGVAIRHEHGAARLRYEELSPEQCVLFGLEEESSRLAIIRETQESLAYERWMDRAMVVAREKEDYASLPANKQAIENRGENLMVARASANWRLRPLARPATPVGSRSWSRGWYRYSRCRYYSPYGYVFYYRAAPNSFGHARAYDAEWSSSGLARSLFY